MLFMPGHGKFFKIKEMQITKKMATNSTLTHHALLLLLRLLLLLIVHHGPLLLLLSHNLLLRLHGRRCSVGRRSSNGHLLRCHRPDARTCGIRLIRHSHGHRVHAHGTHGIHHGVSLSTCSSHHGRIGLLLLLTRHHVAGLS